MSNKPNWKDKIRRTPTHEAIESLMQVSPVEPVASGAPARQDVVREAPAATAGQDAVAARKASIVRGTPGTTEKDGAANAVDGGTRLTQDLQRAQDVHVDVNRDVDVNVNVTRPRRKKFEEQYTRQTFYIHNEILEKLQTAAGDEKGEKTRIINEALKRYLKK